MAITITKRELLDYHELNFANSSHICDVVRCDFNTSPHFINRKRLDYFSLILDEHTPNKLSTNAAPSEETGRENGDNVRNQEIVLDNLETEALEFEKMLVGEDEMKNDPKAQAYFDLQKQHKKHFLEEIHSKGLHLKVPTQKKKRSGFSMNY